MRVPFILLLAVYAGLTQAPPAAESQPGGGEAAGAKLVEVYAADAFFEGPAWNAAEGKLYFTAFFRGPDGQPSNQQILRLERPGEARVWLDRTEGINGTFVARDGRLLGAQAYGHRVVAIRFDARSAAREKVGNGADENGAGRDTKAQGGRLDPNDARVEVLAADSNWHQPNDVCEAPNGDVYFSDPDFKNRKTSAVYRLRRGGNVGTTGAGEHGSRAGAERGSRGNLASRVERVITDMPLPNGLITSRDGRVLYVSDSHEKHWRAYPIAADGTVGPGRVFFDPDTSNRADPDGMTIDAEGNLHLTGRGGVWVVRPRAAEQRLRGELLAFIAVPEFCSNATLGGAEGRTLYITCKGKVYQVALSAFSR